MKTKTSTFGIKGLVISTAIASSLTLGVLAQPNPENNPAVAKYFKQLENFISNNEKILKYKAPDDATEQLQIDEAIERLDQLSTAMDAELKYSAPVEMDDETIQNLEQLAENSIEQLKYVAPLENDVVANEVVEPVLSAQQISKTPAKLENAEPSLQESWLMNAGYMKSSAKLNRF